MGEAVQSVKEGTTNGAALDYEAVVVGAGIAGLHEVYKLREMGVSVIGFEAGTDVGGTWYWNRYPGARVDSQSHIYQYWFSQELLDEWDWSERFPAQPETERYLNYVTEKFDLRKEFRFRTRVESATYDEENQLWTVTTDKGDKLTTRFFISCTGMLSAPQIPFPGHEKFRGQICHTARWPHEKVEMAGKRVGVVGTGATGIQVIQTIAPEVGEMFVFQRTPNYTIPMRNPQYDDADRDALREEYPEIEKTVFNTFAGFDYDLSETPFTEMSAEEREQRLWDLWNDGSLHFWLGFAEVFFDEEVNNYISEFVRNRIRERVKDPETAEKLIPTCHGFGTRRVPLETKYYEAYNQDNVHLVDVKQDAIAEITETGVRLESGAEYELDILVMATGFDAGTGALTRIDIRGRGNQSLKEKWDKDIRSTLGLQVHGFPNLFTVAGPLAPSTAFCNMATCLIQQGGWVADTIGYLRDQGQHAIEPTEEKEAEWVNHHDEVANQTLVVKTDSWYMGANIDGKPRRLLSYIGGANAYHQMCDELKEKGYPGFAIS